MEYGAAELALAYLNGEPVIIVDDPIERELGITGRLSPDEERDAFAVWGKETIRSYFSAVQAARSFYASTDVLTNEELAVAGDECAYAAHIALEASQYGNENYQRVALECRELLLKAVDKLRILSGGLADITTN